MDEIFDIIRVPEKEEKDEIELRLGIRVKLAGQETICPVTKSCHSFEALEVEAQAIKDHLDKVVNRAKEAYGGSTIQAGLDIKPDMAPEEIWAILSGIDDLDSFINGFNTLEEDDRRNIAEHVLTRCNIFAGKASIFSSRYNSESALLE